MDLSSSRVVVLLEVEVVGVDPAAVVLEVLAEAVGLLVVVAQAEAGKKIETFYNSLVNFTIIY